MNTEENPTLGLHTTLASSICKVLGDIDDTVREFDELRYALKNAKNKGTKDGKNKRLNMKDDVSTYNHLKATLCSKVLAKRTSFDRRLKQLEHEHFKKHHRLPDRSNSVYAELLSPVYPLTTGSPYIRVQNGAMYCTYRG